MQTKAAAVVLGAALSLAGCAATTPAPRFSPTSPADRDAPESPPAPIPPLTTRSDAGGAAAPTEKAAPAPGHEHHAAPPTTSTAPPPATSDLYTCTMHPEVRQASPGTCAKCGMALVRADKPRSRP